MYFVTFYTDLNAGFTAQSQVLLLLSTMWRSELIYSNDSLSHKFQIPKIKFPGPDYNS